MKFIQIVLVVITLFSLSTVAIPQTVLEREVASRYLQSLHYQPYSDNNDYDPIRRVKIDAFLYGTIAEKRALLKTYITNVLLVQQRAERDRIQARLTVQENRIAALEAYIK